MRTPTPDDPLRVVELFSGIGSQAMALKNLGIPCEVVGTSEIDVRAMQSYEAIHGPVNQLGDITQLEALPECDLVTYSFPCLTGDTPALTSKGYIPIRDIEPGDCVYSLDGRYHRVLASGCTGTELTFRFKVRGRDEIRCTGNHCFLKTLADGTRQWTMAGTLVAENMVVVCDGDSEGGQHLSLSEVEYVRATHYAEKVYDLTVEGSSSFIVNGIVTHNCQDLSIAGYQRGMARDSGTRSALLWEVGRLLEVAHDRGTLPECLLMENVPAVLNRRNIDSFNQWIAFLDSIGYTSSYAVLNAVNFDVPQNRKRCFMVSSLGGRRFVFPEGRPTEKRLKDILEDDVPENFFLSDEKIARYEAHKRRHDAQGHGLGWRPCTPEQIGHTVTIDPTRHGFTFVVTEGDIGEYRREHDGEQNSDSGIKLAGVMTDTKVEQARRVYSPEGNSPTITSEPGTGSIPKVDVTDLDSFDSESDEPEIRIAGTLKTTNYDMMNRVYGVDGVAPTLRTMATGGGQMPKIEVSEPTEPEIQIAGNLEEGFDQGGRVYDPEGVSPSILAANGGNRMPKIEVSESPENVVDASGKDSGIIIAGRLDTLPRPYVPTGPPTCPSSRSPRVPRNPRWSTRASWTPSSSRTPASMMWKGWLRPSAPARASAIRR